MSRPAVRTVERVRVKGRPVEGGGVGDYQSTTTTATPAQSGGGIPPVSSVVSHRGGVLVAGAVGILFFRLVLSGKLGKSWAALWAGGGSTAGSTAPSVVDPATDNGAGDFGTPNPSDFGGPAPSYAKQGGQFGLNPSYAKTQSAWLQQDKGLVPDAAVEWNFGTGGKSVPFTLPQNDTFTLVSESGGSNGGLGGYEVWRDPLGAVLGFLHLQKVASVAPGATVPGGSLAGLTGWPEAPQFAVGGITGPQNAHLAVIANQKAKQEFGL